MLWYLDFFFQNSKIKNWFQTIRSFFKCHMLPNMNFRKKRIKEWEVEELWSKIDKNPANT